MKDKFKIQRLNDETFVLTKGKDFQKVFDVTLTIYNEFIKDVEKIIKHKYKENDEFINLIILLKEDRSQILISKSQLQLLSNWIDRICNILLEKEGVDYKNEELNEYFTIASNFNQKVSKILSPSLKTKNK